VLICEVLSFIVWAILFPALCIVAFPFIAVQSALDFEPFGASFSARYRQLFAWWFGIRRRLFYPETSREER